MTGGEKFPWARLMHLGLGVLRLPSKDFWNATPREIAAAFPAAASPMARGLLEDLMKRYPD